MYRGRLIPGDDPGVSISYDSGQSPLMIDKQPSLSHHGKRIVCLLVTDFAVAAVIRANPELRDRPFALIRMPTASRLTSETEAKVGSNIREGSPLRRPAAYQPHSELSHVSPIARAAGLRPGMTVAQARALIPDLLVTRPSSAAERSAADALLDVAESMSPVAEEGIPGCVWLDLTGVGRLYRYSMRAEGSADDVENSIAEELIRRARRIGLEAAAGIGSNKEIAHLAARCGGARVIAAGLEREFLDWLPLDLLQLDPNGHGNEVELMLKRLGIRRLGDIARLDSRALGSRLGRHGVQLARLARGEGSATVIARPRAETFAEAAEFEYGIDNLEPLGFVLHAMLTQLTARLQMRGLAAGDLRLSLGLAAGGHDNRHVPVAAATTEARSLLTLLKLQLDKSPPPAAVEVVRLTVEARARRPAQTDLFLPAAPAPDRLEAAIARIAGLCGPERVGTLLPADSYRPEAVRLSKFVPPPPLPATSPRTPEHAERRFPQNARMPEPARLLKQTSPLASSSIVAPTSGKEHSHSRPSPATERETEAKVGSNEWEGGLSARASNSTPIVLRAIRPAEEVEVMCTRNSPEFVRGNNICARVISSAGPWRRQGEWWAAMQSAEDASSSASPNNSPFNRDYFELALADGAVYRIYCDLSTGKWFADGVYD
jgi:protein ImuB